MKFKIYKKKIILTSLKIIKVKIFKKIIINNYIIIIINYLIIKKKTITFYILIKL